MSSAVLSKSLRAWFSVVAVAGLIIFPETSNADSANKICASTVNGAIVTRKSCKANEAALSVQSIRGLATTVAGPKGDPGPTGPKGDAGAAVGPDRVAQCGVTVTDPAFGATGDGVTDDTAAIQKALDTKSTTICFPKPAVAYRIKSSLFPYEGQQFVGPGKWSPCLVGDGTGAVIIGLGTNPKYATVHPGGGLSLYGITLSDIQIRNTGWPAINLYRADNFMIRNSVLFSTNTNTVHLRNSARGTIEHSYVTQSGSGWAISAMDNCNALSIFNNDEITGGGLGGGVDVGQSQSIRIRENTLEVIGTYGIRISGSVQDGGVCSNVEISNNYFEQVRRPIAVAEAYPVYGAVVSLNYIANNKSVVPGMPAKDFFLGLGRLVNGKIFSNSYTGSGTEPAVRFYYTKGPGSIELLTNSSVESNYISKVGGLVDYLSPEFETDPTLKPRLAKGNNLISLGLVP